MERRTQRQLLRLGRGALSAVGGLLEKQKQKKQERRAGRSGGSATVDRRTPFQGRSAGRGASGGEGATKPARRDSGGSKPAGRSTGTGTGTKPSGSRTGVSGGKPGLRGTVDTSSGRPDVSYSPARDGDADPGEVVWAWVPYEDDPSQGKDRPVVVIGTLGDDVAALQLTSQDRDDHHHFAIGSGGWDSQQRPSWVKLDRVLRLDPDGIRREGVALDRDRFDRVVAAWEAYDS